ncbi:cyclic phosphodiesterase-like isoform X2 [Castanea sativa]|uniref:cyclic phosphodiesterase-like isoform X2 n=1 Tax=Castanea sativa TaxID=21020 RepID=UPI003F651D5B
MSNSNFKKLLPSYVQSRSTQQPQYSTQQTIKITQNPITILGFFVPHQISVSVSEKTNKSLSSLFASKPTSSSSSSSSSTSTLIFDLMATSEQVEPEKHVYSVWAVPPDDVAARLRKLMDSLGSEFGGPKFEPHITVVGAVSLTPEDAVEKFRSACEGRKAYTATVDRVATGTFFYQCVFLLIHPTIEVVETSAHCCGHFGYKNSTRNGILGCEAPCIHECPV